MTRFTDWLDGFNYMVEGNLTCEQCFDVVFTGKVFPEQGILVFVCTQGHRNQVDWDE